MPSVPATVSPRLPQTAGVPGRKPLDPEKLETAFALIDAGPLPTKAVGIGRSTLYEALAQRTT